MNTKATGTESRRGRRGGPARLAVRIVVIYAMVAVVWILGSDVLSRATTIDPNRLTLIAISKGVLFVAVTSALLFVQIRNDFAHLQETGDELRRGEQRFRRVIELSPVPMSASLPDGRITLLNAAFVSLLGYTLEDIPDLDAWWPAVYPDPEYRQQMIDAWDVETGRSQAAGGIFTPIEAHIRCKDGTERTMLISSASTGAASGERAVVFWDITERERSEAAVRASNERLEQVLRSVIGLIGKVVETRDPYTQGHEEGVSRLSRLIAEEMGLPQEEVDGIEVAALVHDVGKLGVPAEILTKPGALTDLEYALIKEHSQRGYEILRDIQFAWPVAETVLQHHERMDGSGYPAGLAGDDVSMAARVLMVADVIEAMAAHRPYRPALGLDTAMAEITGHPERYDPKVIASCVRLHEAGLMTL